MIPDGQIAEIRQRLSIVEVVGEYIALRKSGARYSGLCPFHTEKTPSFTVTPDKNLYYCFGCQKGGGLIDFVQEMEKVSFPEAVRLLAVKAGVVLQESGENAGPSRGPFLELNRRIAESFHHILLHKPEAAAAREYLQDRKFSPESIQRFKIGYVPNQSGWLLQFLLAHNYSQEFLAQSGLFISRNGQLRQLFWDRVIFPITNPGGDVVGFGGRSLRTGGPKYINSPETPVFRKNEHLFGLTQALPRIREGQPALLVEGYTDVIALEAADMAALATLGTSVNDGHARVLARYVEGVTVVFDGDSAGRRAAIRSAQVLEQRGLTVNIARVPTNKDPADLAFSGDFDKLAELVKLPLSAFQFIVQHAVDEADVRTAAGKESVFREAYAYLSSVDSEVRREGLLQELADRVRVDLDTVRREYLRRSRGETSVRPVAQGRYVPASGRAATGSEASVDLDLMLRVAVNRDQFERVRNRIDIEDLVDEHARQLFVALEECFRQGVTEDEELLQRIEDPGLRTRVLQKLTAEEFTVQREQLVSESIAQLRTRSLRRRRSSVERQLRSAEAGSTDPAALRHLQVEKMHLDSELEKIKKVDSNVRHPE